MRRVLLVSLAMIVLVSGSRLPVFAQASASPSIDLQIEQKRKRAVVPPPSETGQAVKDADAAARQLDQQRRVEELSNKAMQSPPPPLDESVVEGSRQRQLQEGPRR